MIYIFCGLAGLVLLEVYFRCLDKKTRDARYLRMIEIERKRLSRFWRNTNG